MTNFGKMAGLLTLKNETLLGAGGGRGGRGAGTCVPALNFRYGRFARFEEEAQPRPQGAFPWL